MRILLVVSALVSACAEDPAVPVPAEPVVSMEQETARTAVNVANEANLFVGKLHWGKDPATGKPWTGETLRRLRSEGKGPVARGVRDVLGRAEQALKTNPKAPSVELVFYFGFCARVAEGETQAACKARFRAAYFGAEAAPGLVSRIKPVDYPVEQAAQFATLLRAVDLFFPLMTIDEKAETRSWLHAFADQDPGKKPDTWRLTTKLTAAVLLEDPRLEKSVEELVKAKVAVDLLPPEGWKPDATCRNNRSEKLFGSREFRQRDALLFHVYTLQAYTTLLGAKPAAVTPAGQAAIVRALDFLKPYYVGSKSHREFVCTSVAADRDRAKSGQKEYQQRKWRRDGARTLLKMAQPHYPAIEAWAAPALDENHPPALKLVAALQAAR